MPTLVLLPGLDGTGHLFADFVTALRQLKPALEVIIVAYPPDTPLDYAGLEPLARSLLPVDRPWFLLAESFSGPIAISIASSAPAGLSGVILSCSFVRNPLPFLSFARPIVGMAPVAPLPIAFLDFFVLGRFSTPARREALAKSLAAVAPSVLRVRAKAALSVDVADLVAGIKVPLLYLRAREDRIVLKKSCQTLVSLAPTTQVAEFSAPHFLLQVLPVQAVASILDFMEVVNGRL